MPRLTLTLTDKQANVLLGLVTAATNVEAARYRRMVGRPPTAHPPAAIEAARQSANELAALETLVLAALEPEPNKAPATLDDYIASGEPVPQRFGLGTVGDALGDDNGDAA